MEHESLWALVRENQSAFIRGRLLRDNFKAVHLSAKLLHRMKRPSALIKVERLIGLSCWTF